MIESFDAQRSAARAAGARRDRGGSRRSRVEAAIPGHRCRNVHVACLLERQTTDRVALPAWVLAYRYRGSPYRAIVHGQRAEIVFGTSPTRLGEGRAARRRAIAVAIVAIVALIAMLLS